MNRINRNSVSRATVSLAMGLALAVGSIGVASASGRHGTYAADHDCASAKKSPFDYARFSEGGYVTAVTAASVTVLRWNGVTTTYTITPTTVFTEGTQPATAAQLVVGDRVNIRLARSAKTTALRINIELAQLAGKVTSVSGDSITITGGQGFSRTILAGTTTTYTESGTPATLAAVTVGASISAKGTIDTNGTTLDALSVTIGHPVTVRGTVTTVTSSSVTINRLNGASGTYTISPTTVITEGAAVMTAASLVAGDKVSIVVNSSALTTAFKINIELAHLVGTVSAVSGTTITIIAGQGFSRTVIVSLTTTYTKGGAPATLADVVVGVKIDAKGTIDTNGTTLDAVSVAITVPGHSETIRGVVTAVSSASVTVSRLNATSATFTITPTTVITEGSTVMIEASIVIGDRVNITVNSTNPSTALKINIELAELGGFVSAVSGNSITVIGGQGFNRTILVSASTTYTKAGASATLADVVVGSKISAQGTIDVNLTTLDAVSVAISKK
jgi:hypothetical protein